MKTKVLVVDDSALMRSLLSKMIGLAPDMEVVGAARDAQSAREMIKELNPDVLTLDVNMPEMDGLVFLERLMRLRPMPVVMVSTLADSGSETTMRALELGAVDFMGKPRAHGERSMDDYADELVEKIRAARSARFGQQFTAPLVTSSPSPGIAMPQPKNVGRAASGQVIFVGASTGGTEAIKEFLQQIPEDIPPILIVQHMPESFTGSFAKRLDGICAPRVIEARGHEFLESGTVYIAPGHSHLRVCRSTAGIMTELSAAMPVNRHRPSVDVLFDSAAAILGSKGVGVILTGMGKDGAQGLLKMRNAGARTFGQDEGSCVVYGMPREAFVVGAVEVQCPLSEMARRVVAVLS